MQPFIGMIALGVADQSKAITLSEWTTIFGGAIGTIQHKKTPTRKQAFDFICLLYC